YVAADPNAPIELTLPVALTLGDTVAITGAEDGGWVLRQNSSQSILVAGLPVIPSEFSWSALPNQPLDGTRYGIASSSDGSHLYALSDDGTQATLSVSHDGGISWADTPLVAATSGAIASSAD